MAKKQATGSTPKKTTCPITKEEFLASAKPIMVDVGGRQIIASVKEFATGSLGWYCGEKIVLDLDGTPVKVQVNLNLILVGSKPE